jgi:hypothetical protein
LSKGEDGAPEVPVEANDAASPEPPEVGPDVELPSTGKKGGVPKGSAKGKSRHLIEGPGLRSKGEDGAPKVPAEPNDAAPPEPLEAGPDVELPSTVKKGGVPKGSPKDSVS